MGNQLTYLETQSHNPYYNLAFEEWVLTHCLEGDYLLLWQNDNTIVIGQNQNTEAEINRAYVDAHNISVVRRATGGGAVYHDTGNLNYSFISDFVGIDHAALEHFSRPIVHALAKLGIHAETSGRNDILINGQKVSGTAQRKYKHRILHHGTLLFDTDPNKIAHALKVDPDKIRAKGVQSVQSRVGNIRTYLKEDMSVMQFWQFLKAELTGAGTRQGALPDTALQEIEALKESKYDTWEWNFGRSPRYTLHNKHRFQGGGIEVFLTTQNGIIKEISFYGDYLSLCPMTALQQALCGCIFCREEVDKILSALPLTDYFGSITKQEVLSLLFYTAES